MTINSLPHFHVYSITVFRSEFTILTKSNDLKINFHHIDVIFETNLIFFKTGLMSANCHM